MTSVKQAIPAFCRGTNEALLAAISEGGRFYPVDRIIWCWIKSGERAGQLAFVTPGTNVGDDPIVEYMVGDNPPCFRILDELPDVEEASEDVLYIVNKVGYIFDGEKFVKVFSDGGGGSGEGSAELLDDLTTSVSVGGITSGKSYAEGTPLETILRDMLNPVGYPTLTNPSATLSATGSKLLETGATLTTTMTVSFNRGSINPAYGTNGYRAGMPTAYKLNGGTSQITGIFNVTVSAETTSYSATVDYNAGQQPKDSVGKDYKTPLPAGTVTSNTLTYEFVDALYANTTNISTIAKLALVSKSAKSKIFNFPAAPETTPEVFDIPKSWNVTGIQVKNDLTGAFEDCAAEFVTSEVTHDDAAGNSVDYVRYTNNLGYDIGNRDIKVLWT